jgi:signal transduction histidine kinase
VTIRRRLQLDFAIIALSALGIALSNYLQYRRLEGDARAINYAGSERMRAYRLATLATHYVAYHDLVTAESIETELDRYRTILVALRDGDRALGLKPAPSREAAEAVDDARRLFELFERRVHGLVSRADEVPPPADLGLEVQAVVAMATSLADRMDRATGEFERASAGAVTFFRRLQVGLFAAVALVALLSYARMRMTVLRTLPALEIGLHELAAGRLGATVRLGDGSDELARLQRAFNETSAELARAREALRAHEAELALRNEQLERADRMKSQFLSTVSHELRTPLTSVIGFAEYMKRGIYGPLDPRLAEPVEAILRNGKSLLALIGDLLDLQKIEAGKLDVQPESFSLGPLVEEAAESFRPLVEKKKLAIETEVAPDLPPVESDPARVRQILFNLVSNAVKFTDKGTVRIRAARDGAGHAVRIEVEDTGIGISPEERERLFRPFEQLDASATRRHGGAGLGLHISKRLADLLGARIEVKSEPGRGSTFAVVLPESRVPAQPAKTE